MIGLLQIRDADEPPVIAIGPAVIGAGEARGIAGIGAAQAIAAMAADIEKSAHLARRAAHDQHRIFAHISCGKIAWLWDLAVVAQEQPAARKSATALPRRSPAR